MGETTYEKEARSYRNQYFFMSAWCFLCFSIAFGGVILFASLARSHSPWALGVSHGLVVLMCYFFVNTRESLRGLEKWTDVVAAHRIMRNHLEGGQ